MPALHAHELPLKSKRSRGSILNSFAVFSRDSKHGALMPRSIRLRKSALAVLGELAG
jgi:hypothetical protein